jgi:hypothetical protein
MPSDDGKKGGGSGTQKPAISLALQRLFYSMQFGEKAASTRQLTASFGWGEPSLLPCLPVRLPVCLLAGQSSHASLVADSADAFMQHDVQEFSRVLCDRCASVMSGLVSLRELMDVVLVVSLAWRRR